MSSRLRSKERMSNSGFHRSGKPTWWVRIADTSKTQWVDIGRVRGDSTLDVVVDLPPGTRVYVGAGKVPRDWVRDTVVTEPIE